MFKLGFGLYLYLSYGAVYTPCLSHQKQSTSFKRNYYDSFPHTFLLNDRVIIFYFILKGLTGSRVPAPDSTAAASGAA